MSIVPVFSRMSEDSCQSASLIQPYGLPALFFVCSLGMVSCHCSVTDSRRSSAVAGQPHGDVDPLLHVVRLGDLVERACRRPHEPPDQVALLRDRLLVNDDALPERGDAEILELHEVQRLALALAGAHHQVERRADDDADERIDLRH